MNDLNFSPDSVGSIRCPIQEYLERLFERYRDESAGQVADYIPELATANPESFAICIATTDGQVYEIGQADEEFTIQSASKPFTYGIALEDQGVAGVLAKVSVEPSGDAFNSISLDANGRPRNPMINAGAIATSGLVRADSDGAKFQRVLDVYSRYAGRQLAVNEAVYRSESETGHRNRAIGHMLRNFDILTEDPNPTLERYFRQCAINVRCSDLARMAATLANGGVNPVTGVRAIREDYCANVLSVMASCGMYDYSGEWIYKVGLAAKSGVGGGILAVLPGRLGIGVYSPPLDDKGNSVRGIAVCNDISRDLGLHIFDTPKYRGSVIRSEYDLTTINSKRSRMRDQIDLIHDRGASTRVHELQGELNFTTVEVLSRRMVHESPDVAFIVLDLRRVPAISDAAYDLLVQLVQNAHAGDKIILFSDACVLRETRLSRKERGLRERMRNYLMFDDLDLALEWCEDQILSHHMPEAMQTKRVELADHDFCRNLAPAQLTALRDILELRSYHAGDFVVQEGDDANELYLLLSGNVSVTITRADGHVKRLSTLSAGMTFGETAYFSHALRSADIYADTDIECSVLSREAFDALYESAPELQSLLLQNLIANQAHMLRRLTREVGALAQ